MTVQQEMVQIEQLGDRARAESLRIMKDAKAYLKYLNQQTWFPEVSAYNILLLMQAREYEVRTLYNQLQVQELKKEAKRLPILFVTEQDHGELGVSYEITAMQDARSLQMEERAAPSVNKEPDALLDRMLGALAIPLMPEEGLLEEGRGAMWDNDLQILFVDPSVSDSVRMFHETVEEFAFSLFSRNSTPYSRKDLTYEAVSVAYLVSRRHGVPVEGLAIDRMPPSWSRADKRTVQERLHRIRHAFSVLEKAL